MTYDPTRAAKAALKAFRKDGHAAGVTEVPVGGLLQQDGTAYHQQAKIETCCILLLAFASGKPEMVPEDFHNTKRSSAGLKSHVRPDGGVFLGSFEAPNDRNGVVVVFGDPAMQMKHARAASIRFRGHLLQQMEGIHALNELGPFANATVTPPSPSLSE